MEELGDSHLHPKGAVSLEEVCLALYDADVERDADTLTIKGPPHGGQLDITPDREIDIQIGVDGQQLQIDETSELSICKKR